MNGTRASADTMREVLQSGRLLSAHAVRSLSAARAICFAVPCRKAQLLELCARIGYTPPEASQP